MEDMTLLGCDIVVVHMALEQTVMILSDVERYSQEVQVRVVDFPALCKVRNLHENLNNFDSFEGLEEASSQILDDYVVENEKEVGNRRCFEFGRDSCSLNSQTSWIVVLLW